MLSRLASNSWSKWSSCLSLLSADATGGSYCACCDILEFGWRTYGAGYALLHSFLYVQSGPICLLIFLQCSPPACLSELFCSIPQPSCEMAVLSSGVCRWRASQRGEVAFPAAHTGELRSQDLDIVSWLPETAFLTPTPSNQKHPKTSPHPEGTTC
jgi:hypothetical protein